MSNKLFDKLGITPGELVVRKKVDDSGDRPWVTYDILVCYDWGCSRLVDEMDNPNTARMFCAVKDLFSSLLNLIEMVNPITKDDDGVLYWQMAIAAVEKAAEKSWEEIQELRNE